MSNMMMDWRVGKGWSKRGGGRNELGEKKKPTFILRGLVRLNDWNLVKADWNSIQISRERSIHHIYHKLHDLNGPRILKNVVFSMVLRTQGGIELLCNRKENWDIRFIQMPSMEIDFFFVVGLDFQFFVGRFFVAFARNRLFFSIRRVSKVFVWQADSSSHQWIFVFFATLAFNQNMIWLFYPKNKFSMPLLPIFHLLSFPMYMTPLSILIICTISTGLN